ncbi:uncharacterized protein LOC122372330 [Amphibalanus amphitrite]|uniref:uncharacterized protein LOC122372330 n=1 Tax=Amphibalanus amphitrite TaxID=1232801 RepID=UPI001C927CCA|nr:uncharacterized protein LOC122372330 [Amphibalanus amphitrite]
MAEERARQPQKHHPWSWHRVFLLFALTMTMILGFVVVGGSSAMMSECKEDDTRRSVYLSDIVRKCNTKRELLHQLMTAWQCDIPPGRLPADLAAASGDLARSCDSDLLTQLRHGGQGTLAAGVLLVVASGGGYGGAISGRSGPLALYIVVTVVTTVLELAAIGLLVYNKSQLDHLPKLMESLLAQPMTEQELVDVVILDGPGGILTAPGGILTAPGEVPTQATQPGREKSGGAGEESVPDGEAGEVGGKKNGTEVNATLQQGGGNGTNPRAEGTVDSAGEADGSTEVGKKSTKAPAINATSSSAKSSASSRVDSSSSKPPAPTEAVKPEGRQAIEKTTTHPETASTSPPTNHSVLLQNTTSYTPSPPTSPISEKVNMTTLSSLNETSRQRRHTDADWEESGEDWDDRTDEVIFHWAPAATDCLLHPEEKNQTHCFTELENKLRRELNQSELVLELMMAPLVCAFLACLLQLTTICAAWHMITDQQSRRPRAQGAPGQLSTPV